VAVWFCLHGLLLGRGRGVRSGIGPGHLGGLLVAVVGLGILARAVEGLGVCLVLAFIVAVDGHPGGVVTALEDGVSTENHRVIIGFVLVKHGGLDADARAVGDERLPREGGVSESRRASVGAVVVGEGALDGSVLDVDLLARRALVNLQ
jgi:hypothetical protein